MIFNDFFQLNILNVNILIAGDAVVNTNTEEYYLYTYYPYSENNCSKINIRLLNVFRTNNKNNTMIEFYPNKLENFWQCPIVVATFNTGHYINLIKLKTGKLYAHGFEGELINFIAKLLNFTIDIVIPDHKWGTIYRNGTVTGASSLVRI